MADDEKATLDESLSGIPMASGEKVKWGILSSADIARKFCAAIPNANNATLVAVASRDKAKAESFIAENCPGVKAYGSYEELLNDPEIQAVYIPVPTGLRMEWVLRAAGKKKHILSEKPIAAKARDTVTMMQSCEAGGSLFMDNTMFMHHERLSAMRDVLDDRELFGTPQTVTSSFCIDCATQDDWAANNIRMKRDMEPLGCLGDLGWYCVRISLWAFGWEDPESVSCFILDETDEGVPIHAVATLFFSGKRCATFDCSFKHSIRQTVEIQSDKACLRVEDFIIQENLTSCKFTVTKAGFADKALHVPNETLKTHEFTDCCQELNLIEKFSGLVLEGNIDQFWAKVATQTQHVLNALVASALSKTTNMLPYNKIDKTKRPESKGKGKGKKPQKKPVFQEVASIDPDSKTVNLEVKVVSISEDEAACSASVGDASGIMTLILTEAQKGLLKEGASLVLRNATVKMAKGFITLIVDKWGKIEAREEAFDFDPKVDNDISKTEYELVQTWIGD